MALSKNVKVTHACMLGCVSVRVHNLSFLIKGLRALSAPACAQLWPQRKNCLILFHKPSFWHLRRPPRFTLPQTPFKTHGVVEGFCLYQDSGHLCIEQHLSERAPLRPSQHQSRRSALGGALLNLHWLQHVIGIELHGAAPQGRLEDVMHMPALALFSGLDK